MPVLLPVLLVLLLVLLVSLTRPVTILQAELAKRVEAAAVVASSRAVLPILAAGAPRAWLEGTQMRRDFERTLSLLFASGVDVELLLLAAADQSHLNAARLIVQKHLATGSAAIGGRFAWEVGSVAADADVKGFFSKLGTYLKRYRIEPGPPVHQSATCEVFFAVDVLQDSMPVALKIMQNKAEWLREQASRKDNQLDERFVIQITDAQEVGAEARQQRQKQARQQNLGGEGAVDESDRREFCLAMPRANRSVFEAIAKERWTGRSYETVSTLLRQVCEAVQHLHSQKLIHADIKPRNIMRHGSAKEGVVFKLIDMDAAANIGDSARLKISSAYCPPELGRLVLWAAEQSDDIKLDQGPEVVAVLALAQSIPWITVSGNLFNDGIAWLQLAMKSDRLYKDGDERMGLVACTQYCNGRMDLHKALKKKKFTSVHPAIEQNVGFITKRVKQLKKKVDKPALEKMQAAAKEKKLDDKKAMELEQAALDARTIIAHPSFDAFSLGALLFEVSSRTPLFPSDRSDDNLIEDSAKVELSNWLGIDKDRLSRVFKADDRASVLATDEQIDDCKNLLKMLLQGDPEQRPSIDEVLAHRFLTPGAAAPSQIAELWHCFISHAQLDASGTVGTLYYMLHCLGSLSPWVDMHEENLTLEGMKEGVRSSEVFLLVLTETVLASWFCQEEMKEAIRNHKTVQILLEEESRFSPVDLAGWTASQGQSERTVLNAQRKAVAVPPEICKMIDENLPKAIVYRRREFEAAAMVRELCKRHDLAVPYLPAIPPPPVPVSVCVIAHDATAAAMRAQLQALFAEDGRLALTDDLAAAEQVLLLLSEGVVDAGTDSLQQLQAVLTQDNADAAIEEDRIVAVYDGASWEFSCDAQKSAPADVQKALNDHEAMVFRSGAIEGRRHEFEAMVRELLKKLGCGARGGEVRLAAATGRKSGEVERLRNELAERHDRTKELEREASFSAAMIKEKDVALQEKDAALHEKAEELAKVQAELEALRASA